MIGIRLEVFTEADDDYPLTEDLLKQLVVDCTEALKPVLAQTSGVRLLACVASVGRGLPSAEEIAEKVVKERAASDAAKMRLM